MPRLGVTAPESVGLGWSTVTSTVLGGRGVRDAPGAEPHLGLGKLTWSVTEGLFTGGIVKRDARAQLVKLGRGGRYLPGIE